MLKQVGASSLEELVAQGRSRRRSARARRWRCRNRCRSATRCRSSALIADRNKAYTVDDRHGLSRHASRPGDPAQRAGKSRLVHGLHALPGRRSSQGRLEALLNFQQMVIDLTGLRDRQRLAARRGHGGGRGDGDGAPGGKAERNTFFVDADTHPQTIAVIATRASAASASRSKSAIPSATRSRSACSRRCCPYPGSSGAVRDLPPAIERGCTRPEALAIVATDLLALALLKPPGELGADIAVGSSQRFGVPMGYGGPHAAFFATRDAYKRPMPGRIIGVSVDASGQPALRMALQTREQHIRREKATSNICTAQVLLAVIAAHVRGLSRAGGPQEDRRRAHRCARARRAALARRSATRSSPSRSSTRSPCACRGGPHAVAAKAREQRHQSARGRCRHARHLARRDDAARASSSGSSLLRRDALTASTLDALDRETRATIPPALAAADAVPDPAGVRRSITPRPRCCAICGGCRARTSRSTAR